MAKTQKEFESIIPVKEALRRRTRRTQHEDIATDFPGTVLKVEKGTHPGVSIVDRGRLIRTAATFYTRKAFLEGRSAVQLKRERFIKTLAIKYPGLRGVVSPARNFVVNVFPKNTIEWDRNGLQEALGETYPAIVAEDMKLTVTAPIGYPLETGPLTAADAARAIRLGFLAIGMPEEDLPKIVDTDIELRVDEPKLYGMAEKGVVDLTDTGIAKETWAISTEPFTKS